MTMTPKQAAYIVSLCNQITGLDWPRYIGQHRKFLGLSSFQVEKLTRSQASAIIDRLKAQVEEAE